MSIISVNFNLDACKVSFLIFLKIFLNFEKRSLMWSMFEIIKSLPQRHLHACCTLKKSTNRKSTRCLCWQCGLFKQEMKNIRNSQSSRQFSLVSEIRRSFLTGAWPLEYVSMYWVEQKRNDWFIENAVDFLQSKVFHWSKRKWLIYRKCSRILTKQSISLIKKEIICFTRYLYIRMYSGASLDFIFPLLHSQITKC